MDLVSTIRRGGGVMLTSQLVKRGISLTRMKRAVAAGILIRPSRGWIALPSADPMLLGAAGARVVLTCITAAAHLDWWDVGEKKPHLAAAPHGHPILTRPAKVHWNEPVVRRAPGQLVDSAPNVLSLVAECQPFEQAVAIWEAALRVGAAKPELMRALPLRPRAMEVLEAARPYADAGTESILFHRLTWLGLPRRRQTWILGHRVDLLIGDRLVIQVDGGHHVDAQRASDNEHDAQLRLAGYHPIRVTYWQLMNEWHVVQELILQAIAQGLHLAKR